ncbi:MAG: DUF4230 domain-containing protein [Oscillospiraceae bacterium]|nr:DUF4230 domain-containing protein [Oscillospiraceae bacterium]
MKNQQKLLNIIAGTLALLLLVVLIWGVAHRSDSLQVSVDDGIGETDWDTIDLNNSGVTVDFAKIILSHQNESRRLIVSTQTGTATTKLTDRVIEQLDFDFLKKTQNVSYTGTGYFVVDLDQLTAANITENKSEKTITIRIGHAYLQAIEIDPNDIIIDEVQESLLARGDIKLTVADFNAIEKELRTRLENTFDTESVRRAADQTALRMVKAIYEPIVKAIDSRYSVIVEFQ